jgi:hypothetical protein
MTPFNRHERRRQGTTPPRDQLYAATDVVTSAFMTPSKKPKNMINKTVADRIATPVFITKITKDLTAHHLNAVSMTADCKPY